METAVDPIPDPTKAFSPTMEVHDEFQILRAARKSLGGESLRPIEIDMDILADAYPREGGFLASTTENSSSSVNIQAPITPSKSNQVSESPRFASGRKTPSRKFFRSEHEREYARSLMKELVQIYILQGAHGKDAFRQALNETRRRIHVRRGEAAPSPPAVLSPVHESPYPKLSPPRDFATPLSSEKPANPDVSPSRVVTGTVRVVEKSAEADASPSRRPPVAPRTPSRVQSMVAAIQSSTPSKPASSESAKRTPGSTRVKAVAEALERKTPNVTKRVADDFQPDYGVEVENLTSPPKKQRLSEKTVSPSPKKASRESRTPSPKKQVGEEHAVRTSSRLKKAIETPPSKRKNEEIVERPSTSRRGRKATESAVERAESPPADKRTRRAAAMAEAEEVAEGASGKKSKKKDSADDQTEEKVTVRKKATAKAPASAGRKRKTPALTTIPEDEAVVVPVRPGRKAKTAANEGIIKK